MRNIFLFVVFFSISCNIQQNDNESFKETLSYSKYVKLNNQCISARNLYHKGKYLEAKELLKECAFLIETASHNFLLLAKSYFFLNQMDSGYISLINYFQHGGKKPNDLPQMVDSSIVDSLFKHNKLIYSKRINLELDEELNQMLDYDQRWRSTKEYKSNDSLKAIQDSIDFSNQERLKEIVSVYGWPGIYKLGNRYSPAASIIAMHSDLELSLYFLKESVISARCNESLWSTPTSIAQIRVLKHLKSDRKIQFHFVEFDQNQNLIGDWKWEIETISRILSLKQESEEFKIYFTHDVGLSKKDRIKILNKIKNKLCEEIGGSTEIEIYPNINEISGGDRNASFITLELL